MNVAYIPVRGGSKSIPKKNIKLFCGMPLVYWTIKACVECERIDVVYIATDCEIIKNTVNSFGFDKVTIVGRSEESSSDTASTECAMLEFAAEYEFDNIVLVQATSPLLSAEYLYSGFDRFFQEDIDSVLSVVTQKRFIWELKSDNTARATNYDYYNRPRRQEFAGYYVENGAFYITTRSRLLKSKCRISGKIGIVEMPEATYFEIDEPSDWEIMEALMRKEINKNIKKPSKIKMFLTDCDGTLTDGGMYYSENGEQLKRFNAHDGQGFAFLKDHGIITGIITGESSKFAMERAKKLKLDECLLGVQNKVKAIKELCNNYAIDISQVAYVGDDFNDIEAIMSVGFGACVADGNTQARSAAKYVCRNNGGKGAVREVIDIILNLHI